MVRTNNVVLAQADAAVVLIKKTDTALAVKTDCNGRYVYLNPRRGAMIAVAESARNIVCSGGQPVAITNCLNFGNPYKPEVYWQFSEAVAGMGEACRVFDTPVTGGNVSFYNESPTASVYPTPVIGMLGVVDTLKDVTTAAFKSDGDIILLLGETRGHIGGSEYLAIEHGKVAGDAPPVDLQREKKLQQFLLKAIRGGLILSAHDCSEGGLAVALAECCFTDPVNLRGVEVTYEVAGVRSDGLLFGEDQGRVVISASSADVKQILSLAAGIGVPACVIGRVTLEPRLRINREISADVRGLSALYYGSIEEKVGS
jgi:phosphoribosylformylglycinamidine synthase